MSVHRMMKTAAEGLVVDWVLTKYEKAKDHLYRGRQSSSDGKGCLWILLLAVLFIGVMLAMVGNKERRLNRLENNRNVEQEEK